MRHCNAVIRYIDVPWGHKDSAFFLSRLANLFESDITVASAEGEEMDVKSIMDLLRVFPDVYQSHGKELYFNFEIEGVDEEVAEKALIRYAEITRRCIVQGIPSHDLKEEVGDFLRDLGKPMWPFPRY